ncbi:MAG: PLP-dependent aminotransferase family protein, partial [Bacteroidota bacterium]
CKMPEGGLAAWVNFTEEYPLEIIRARAQVQGLLISRTVFSTPKGEPINAIRMGFASLNEAELVEAMEILKKSL